MSKIIAQILDKWSNAPYLCIIKQRSNNARLKKLKSDTMTFTATFTKVKDAQQMGEYVSTSVDTQKNNADFLIKQMNPIYIKWKSGESQIVTRAKLNKLQKAHTWATDF